MYVIYHLSLEKDILANMSLTGGGDAITLAGTDLIWIDHVKTSLIGRQHVVLGEDAS